MTGTQAELSDRVPAIEEAETEKMALIRYVLLAYEIAVAWEAQGEARKMIFSATYVTNPLKFREDVDIFSAALQLVATATERTMSGSFVGRGSRACKLAWLNRWSSGRFEYEMLCDGISGLAQRWTEIATPGAPNSSPVVLNNSVVAAP